MINIFKHSKNLSIYLILLLLIFACSAKKKLAGKTFLDKQLVGTWVGQEVDKQMSGTIKEWQMTRYDDGTFVLFFNTINKDGSRKFSESGTWWVKDSLFYEYHSNSKLTDSYKYQVINKDLIKFELVNTDIKFNNPQYIFYDKRKK